MSVLSNIAISIEFFYTIQDSWISWNGW